MADRVHVFVMTMPKKAWAQLNEGAEMTILRAKWDGISGDVVAIVWDDDEVEELAIARRFAASADMLEMLRVCRVQFRDYEHQHRAKGTPEADVKAKVNGDLAAKIDDVIRIAITGS